MTRVLILSTSRKTRGGITAVLKAHEQGEQWTKYHCHWVQTHRDGNSLRKLIYLFVAMIDYFIRIPFYDIVHVHFSLSTTAKRKVPFVKIAKLLHKKVILHLHCGSQIHDIWNKDYDYLFSVADVSLFLSETLLHMVEKHTGAVHDYRVCYNPCPFVEKEPVLVQKKQILFSGTLYFGKGYQDLIRAFGKIAKKHNDWQLILAGNGEIDKGKLIAKELDIENQIQFLGWVSGVEKDIIFRESSFFCLPSYAEGFPMAVLDAWAYGLPVITTPVGGIPDIAKDGENMLLFEPGDIEMLANKLELMITNITLRNHIAKASSEFANKKFSLTTINRQLGDLYQELSNN